VTGSPAAHLVLPALRATADGSFDHESSRITEALALGVGGFILFGGTAGSVRALTAGLAGRAGRPLLIASDLERGAGQQVEGLSELPPPAALASLGDLDAVRWAGGLTASEARSVGINWVLAPDADLDVLAANPIVQTRSFGADPANVADAVAAWISGCQAAGAMASVKHWPGHGRTSTDSHDGLPVVGVDEATWRQTDLRPFLSALAAGVGSVMTCHVAFPSLDPSGAPATLSSPILHRLREEHGFGGLIVTDALIMAGARGEGALVRALAAGCDLLLYPPETAAAVSAVDSAIASGRLPESQVAASVMRAERAASHWSAAPVVAPTGRFRNSAALADALLARPLLRGEVPRLSGGLDLVVVDDDIGGAWPASPSDYLARALRAAGTPLGGLGDRVVLAFAEPRASKGRAGFSEENRRHLAELAPGASLIVLFGHSRLVAEIPGGAPVLLAWHRQRLMQEAVARWLVARLG
jgi:beta-glucosidase-like glycosyl hydrolase